MMMEKILLIDDDPDDTALVREALLEIDRNVLIDIAQNGIEALELLQNNRLPAPDCIFLDQNMPKMDGRQCLVQLRKIPRLNNTQVFILTTSRLHNEGMEFIKLGANFCFTKPNLYSELKNVLAIALSGSWQRKIRI